MTFPRLVLVSLAAAAALAASGCGGGAGDVPSGAIAVVDGTEISKAALDELFEQARAAYEANKQEFPKAGTPDYQNLQTRYVALLVQREQLRQEAEELGVEVTDEEVEKAEKDLIAERFEGKRAEYLKAVEQQGLTLEQVRESIEYSVLEKKIFDEVTKDVEVTDADILEYYTQNQASYGTPESRDVRHILVAEKTKDGKVDFEASKEKADEVYAQLQDGADFTELVRDVSADTASKSSGGKLTISRGQTVPEFDKTAFELDRGEVSRPVKTQYGYHIIEALSPVRPAKTTPLAKVRASIRATLLQQKRNELAAEWAEKLQKEYEGKVSYAEGYEPPELPEVPTETQ